MRLEELPAVPTCTGTCACNCSHLSGQVLRYKTLYYYLFITAMPYMCRLFTEAALGFGLSHVPVLSSSRYHAIVSPGVCSAVTSLIIAVSLGN